MINTFPYPAGPRQRDRWILERRPARNQVDPYRPYAFMAEDEPSQTGEVVSVGTIFLTNRECPWRCAMCDLWRNTLSESVPPGAIPTQIDFALERLPLVRQVKLYNSGSFFDPRAIPVGDDPAIAVRVRPFERVIVECHPALVGERSARFADLLPGRLEVAMGLETAHPQALEKLNKRMTLPQFVRAARFLRDHQIALRVFILVQPPFLDRAEGRDWTRRSIEFAFDHGAEVVSLIPTRPGNGALETLAAAGAFSPPRLEALEDALEYGVGLRRGRVFADLWDLDRFAECPACFPRRRDRLRQMNLNQVVLPLPRCDRCEGGL